MAYGKIKAEALIYNNSGNDVELAISEIITSTGGLSAYALLAGATFTGDVNFDDGVIIKGDSTNGSGELTLNCENNSHGVKIKGPPHSAAANYTLTLPNNTGTSGQVLTTNGSGVSSWSTIDLASKLSLTGGTLTGDLGIGNYPNDGGAKIFADEGQYTARKDDGSGGLLLYRNGTNNSDKTVQILSDGSITAVGNLTIGDKIIHNGDTNTAVRFPASDTVSVETAGSERLRIDSSGRLLVGTTTEGHPSANELTVASSGITGITIRSGTSDSGNLFFSDGTSGNDELRGYIQYLHADNALVLAANALEALRIDSSGRVGIGTSSFNDAQEALRVQSSSGGTDTFLTIKAQSDSGKSILNFGDSDFNEGRVIYDHSSNSMQFLTDDSERMRLDSSGKLLVGTTTASSFSNRPVTVGDTSIASNYLEVRASSACGVVFSDGSGNNDSGYRGSVEYNHSSDYLFFRSAATERMRIDSTGMVRTFSNTVNGALNVFTSQGASTSANLILGQHSATSVSSGTLSFIVFSNGDVRNSNNAYGSISDAKLKENIIDANSQWDNIKDIRVRNYNFIEGQTHTQIGVVAQEVETVSPGLVTESPDRDEENNDLGTVTKSVNYSVLYMKAVKALQEAMDRIETLETKVAALEGA